MVLSDKNSITRRRFVQGAALAGSVITAAQMPSNRAVAAFDGTMPNVPLEDGSVILFQGDSITDAGRVKNQQAPNNLAGLGHGYSAMITTGLLGAHPTLKLQCFNRGISGHKVPDLAARWQRDCIDMEPDVLSILIGVNDIWHKLAGRYDGTVETYEEGFAQLLATTRQALPDVTLVVCDPFVLRCGAVNDAWFPEFDQRRAAAKRVSDDAGAIWVPFQQMFDDVLSDQTPPDYWAGDGVHPTVAGHALMARTWLDATGLG